MLRRNRGVVAFFFFSVWTRTSTHAAAAVPAFLQLHHRRPVAGTLGTQRRRCPGQTELGRVALPSSAGNDDTFMSATQLVGVDEEDDEDEGEEGSSAELRMNSSVSSDGRSPAVRKADGGMGRWARRLITPEDPFSVHKLSALIYTLTSFAMMGTAAARWFVGRQELFATVPYYLEPAMYLFCASNLFMRAASVRMAWLHRRNDLASRNAFVGTAGSSLFSAYFLLWAGPFAPEFVTSPLASRVGFGILCAWNLLCVGDTMIRAKEIIDGREDRKSQDENASFALEYLRYIATAAWPLPIVVATGYVNSVLYDHSFIVNVFDHVLVTDGMGLQASVFYNNVMGSMAAAYGSFFVTLRDKMLISKRAEWMGIGLFSVPVLIWTVDISARFFPYVTGSISLDG